MEESSRAPLMIYDPRSPTTGQHLRSTALTGNIDITPEILDLAGIPRPANMDGQSLLGLVKNPTGPGHEQLAFINVSGKIPTRSLTCLTPQFKYTYWWYGDNKMEPTEDLFDLKNDPLELKNLARDP